MAGQSLIHKISLFFAQKGLISEQDALSLARDFKGTDLYNFESFLLEQGIVDKAQLLNALSAYYEVPSFDVVGYMFNHDRVTMFPKEVLLKHLFIPVDVDEDIIAIVAANPHDTVIYDIVREYVPFAAEFSVGIARDIIDEIRAFYQEAPDDLTETPEQDLEEYYDIVDGEEL